MQRSIAVPWKPGTVMANGQRSDLAWAQAEVPAPCSGAGTKNALAIRSGARSGALPMEDCRGPVGGSACDPVLGRLPVMVDRRHGACEQGPIREAVGVDHRPGSGFGRAHRADVNAAASANQKLGGARAKPVRLHQIPVLGPDLGRTERVTGGSRCMSTAERTAARPDPDFLRRL